MPALAIPIHRLAAVAAACAALALLALAGTARAEAEHRYVVVMEPDASVAAAVAAQRADGNAVEDVAKSGLRGFTVTLTAAEAADLRAQPGTAIVERNRIWTLQDAPANDMLAAAIGLPATVAGTTAGSTVGATHETGEPCHARCNGAASIWYTWTAPAAGQLSVSTEGSTYDTMLAIYAGSDMAGLTQLAANDDQDLPAGHLWSRVQIAVDAGTTYRIAVDGYAGWTGTVALGWGFEAAPGTATAPSAPTGVAVRAADRSLAVSWTGSATDGGSAITAYTATALPSGRSCSTDGAGTGCTITGLKNGVAQSVSVTAVNAVGSATSTGNPAPIAPVAPRAPGAPTGVAAQARDRALVVQWLAPADNGGAAITGYTATASPGGQSCTTTGATSCTISRLVNGRSTTVTVRARNSAGTSRSSAPSPAVAPSATAVQRDIATPAWGVDRLDQAALPLDGRIVEAGIGTGVTAYVIDTGVRADHEQFGGRVAAGHTEVADGNGAGDCNGHGTHVSGTIGGRTYGVAPGVKLVPVRVLDCYGIGDTIGVIAGINWMIADHQAGVPAVANMSLGGGYSDAMNAAVAAASADGITMVVAAGNNGADACWNSPASEPSAITVGATDSTDRRAWFSSIGRCVDVFAPGLDIPSAWNSSSTATATLSGTSMASPHAAGVAAVLLSLGYATADIPATIASTALSGVVGDPGTGSPNRLLTLSGVTPKPAVVARISSVHVAYHARVRTSRTGSYIVTGRASHPGTLRLVLTSKSGLLRVVRTFAVAAGPFTAVARGSRAGLGVEIDLDPTDLSVEPVAKHPPVDSIVIGTATHRSKPPRGT